MTRATAGRIVQRMEPVGELMPWDSPPAFLVKALLYPFGAVASLWMSLLVCGEPFRKAYFLAAVLAFIATSDVLKVAPMQNVSEQATSLHTLVVIARRWLIVVAFLWALISVSGLRANFRPHVWLAWAMLTPLVLWLSAIVARRSFGMASAAGHILPRNAIIVGLNDLSGLLERRLREDRSSRIQVVAYFDDLTLHAASPDPAVRDTRELRKFIRSHDVRIVFITWPMAREQRIVELLDILRDSTVSIYFVPDVSLVGIIQGRLAAVSGIPVIGVCESPFFGVRELQKRMLDVSLSALLIVLLAPMLVAIAVGIRLSSPGPILFKQRRYGLDGREFTVYKFRSMSVTEDGTLNFSAVSRGDRRVTQFGALLRRTSLDELPQLFNVLGGRMSLVGPRPHVVAMNEAYRRQISGYMQRHKVRPGITGWAQINGSRGGNDLDSMKRDLHWTSNTSGIGRCGSIC